MKRRTVLLLLGLGAASAIGSLPAETPVSVRIALPPATEPIFPTTRTVTRRVEPLPESYQHLLTRSMFSRGGQASAVSFKMRGGKGGGGGEDAFAFRGATEEDGRFVAFVEDTAGGGVKQVHAGDSIAGGRITDITLDALTFESRGNTSQIRVGYNLAGAALPPASQPTTQPKQGKGQHGAPPQGPQNGPPGGKGPHPAPPPDEGEIQLIPGEMHITFWPG